MNFNDYLTEGNPLSRVLSSIMLDNKCIAIVTASREENTEQENEKANDELRKILKDLSIGYRTARGHYPELLDNGERINHVDDSTIIIENKLHENDLKELIVKFCKKYNQDSVLFKYCNGTVGCFDKNGKFDTISSNFKVNKLSEYMTEVKKRNGIIVGSFVFENCSNFESICYTNSISALQHYMNAKKILENA